MIKDTAKVRNYKKRFLIKTNEFILILINDININNI
jgi:hypothetical protein